MKCSCHFPYKEEYFLNLLRMRALREELLKIFHCLGELLAKTLHSQLDLCRKLIEIQEIPLSGTKIKAVVACWADRGFAY